MNNNEKLDMLKYFSSKIVIGILGMIALSLYSKMLNPNVYGAYSLIIGFINVLISIFIGWLGSSALRYYKKEDKSIILSNVMLDWIIMLIFLIFLLFITSKISPNLNIEKYFLYVVFIIVGLSLYEIFEKILRVSNKTNIYIIAIILQSFFNVTLFYILVSKFNLGIDAIFIANIISHFIFITIALSSINIKKNIDLKLISLDMQQKFLKYGLPMVGVWGISWILSYSDRFIILHFFSNYQVGLYDMSYRIVENIMNLFITSFSLSTFPMLLRAWNNDGKKSCIKLLQNIFKYFFIIMIPLLFGILAVRDKMYTTFLDPQYVGGILVYCFTAFGIFFMGINNILYKLWQLEEKTYKILIYMTVSVVLNIVLNLILVPIYGYIIAAATTFFSYLFINVIVSFSVQKTFSFNYDYKVIIKCLINSVIMYICIRIINSFVNGWFGLITMICIGIVIYAFLTLITKVAQDEIALLRSILMRRNK